MSGVRVLDAHNLWKNLTEGWFGWVFYGVLGIVFALLLFHGFGFVLGNTFPVVTVSSESMVPTLNIGDVVIVKSEDEYSTGDIIVFDGWKPQPIIHRVVAVVDENYKIDKYKGFGVENKRLKDIAKRFDNYKGKVYITKGDHNEKYDQSYGIPPIKDEEIYGKNVFVIPYLGLFKVGMVKLFSFLTSG